MLLFRSEEHLGNWLDRPGIEKGATLSMEQQWGLASAYYANRMEPGWRRRAPEETQQVFAELGLTGPFWQIV